MRINLDTLITFRIFRCVLIWKCIGNPAMNITVYKSTTTVKHIYTWIKHTVINKAWYLMPWYFTPYTLLHPYYILEYYYIHYLSPPAYVCIYMLISHAHWCPYMRGYMRKRLGGIYNSNTDLHIGLYILIYLTCILYYTQRIMILSAWWNRFYME